VCKEGKGGEENTGDSDQGAYESRIVQIGEDVGG